MSDSVTTALLAAADKIELQSDIYKAGRPDPGLSTTCTALAIGDFAPDSVRYGDGTSRSYHNFFQECGDRLGLPPSLDPDRQFGRIVEWNDAPERTKDEVVAALREAARS